MVSGEKCFLYLPGFAVGEEAASRHHWVIILRDFQHQTTFQRLSCRVLLKIIYVQYAHMTVSIQQSLELCVNKECAGCAHTYTFQVK